MEEMFRSFMAASSRELMEWYDEANRVNIWESTMPWGLSRETFAKLRVEIRKEIIRRMEGSEGK